MKNFDESITTNSINTTNFANTLSVEKDPHPSVAKNSSIEKNPSIEKKYNEVKKKAKNDYEYLPNIKKIGTSFPNNESVPKELLNAILTFLLPTNTQNLNTSKDFLQLQLVSASFYNYINAKVAKIMSRSIMFKTPINSNVHPQFLLAENNQIFCNGSNKHGHLGLNDHQDRFLPTELISQKFLSAEKIKCLVKFSIFSVIVSILRMVIILDLKTFKTCFYQPRPPPPPTNS